MKELTPFKRARSLNRLLANSFFGAAYGPIVGVGGAVFTGYALWMGLQAADLALMASVTAFAGLVYPLSTLMMSAVKRKKAFLIAGGFLETFLLVSMAFIPLISPNPGVRFVLLAGFVMASTLTANSLGPLYASWVSTIIPADTRARFVSRQSVLGTVTGMVVSFLVGQYIDRMGGRSYASFLLPFAFALVMGWGRYAVFLKVPFPAALLQQERRATPLRSMARSLAHPGFRRLLVFNLAIAFGGSIADPFYSVYMLQNLGVSYSFIAILTIVGSLVGILSWLGWGRVSPKLGNRPVLTISAFLRCLIPVLWILATPGNYVPVLIAVYVASSIMGPGLSLAVTTLQYGLVPEGPERSAFFAAWAFIHSILGVVMSLAGAGLARLLAPVSFSVAGIPIDNLKVIFAISSVLLVVPLLILRGVPDVGVRGRPIALRQVFRGNPLSFAYNALLLSLLRDTGVRARAIEGMGHSRSPLAMDTIVQSLVDVDPGIRQAAVKALGGTGSEEAVSLLVAELGNEESPIRLEAAESLGRLRDPRSVDPLLDALEAPDARFAAAAARALGEIGGEQRIADRLSAKLVSAPPVDKVLLLALVEALGRLQDARVIRPALEGLERFRSPIARLQILNSVCWAVGAGNEFYDLLAQENLRLAQRLYRIQNELRRYLPHVVPLRRLLARDAIDELALAIEEEDYAKIPDLALLLADTVQWREPGTHPGVEALRIYSEVHRQGQAVRPEVFAFVCLDQVFADTFRGVAGARRARVRRPGARR